MIKKTLLLIVVVVAAILGYATTKPDTFSVQREITIKAPPEKIAGLITDF
ncbi:polyketide cyclase, partial [Enterococcus faecium]|nr:polyketide cyclase [Enterococcus faecium]